jgi:hypothetical protein
MMQNGARSTYPIQHLQTHMQHHSNSSQIILKQMPIINTSQMLLHHTQIVHDALQIVQQIALE